MPGTTNDAKTLSSGARATDERPRLVTVNAPLSAEAAFVALFNAHFHRLVRVLDRLSGEPELAADLAQEAFIRLYRRGAPPDAPEAWLITVALNLFRNARTSEHRRRELLTLERGAALHSQPAEPLDDPDDGEQLRQRVRGTLAHLTEREQQLLVLRAEGYDYREIAHALALREASVGVMLARAKQRFRTTYEETDHAS